MTRSREHAAREILQMIVHAAHAVNQTLLNGPDARAIERYRGAIEDLTAACIRLREQIDRLELQPLGKAHQSPR